MTRNILTTCTVLTATLLAATWIHAQEAASDKPKEKEKRERVDRQGDRLPTGALARFGSTRFRATTTPVSFAYLDEGKQLLCGKADGTFVIWETATGKELRHFGKALADLRGRTRNGPALTVSTDGKIAAAARPETDVTIWNIETGELVRTIERKEVGQLVFSPDSKTLAGRTNRQALYLWDVATGEELTAPKVNLAARNVGFVDPSPSMAFSPNGETLIVAVTDGDLARGMGTGYLRFFSMETKEEIRSIKGERELYGHAPVVSPDGKFVAWSSGARTAVGIYDFESGKPVHELKLGGQVNLVSPRLAFAPDSKLLAIKDSTEVLHFWDVSTGKEAKSIARPVAYSSDNPQNIYMPAGFAFAPDGKTMAVGYNSDDKVHFVDVESGKPVTAATGPRGAATALGISTDGKVLMVKNEDNIVRRWDLATGRELSQFSAGSDRSRAAFSPDGKLAAFAFANNTVHIVQANDGKVIHKIQVPGMNNPAGNFNMPTVAFSLDGTRLGWQSAVDNEFHAWEAASAKEVMAISGSSANRARNGFGAWALSPDGSVAALTSGSGLDPYGSGRPRTPANKLMLARQAVGASKQFWNVETKGRSVTKLAFTPNGRSIISADSDGSVSLWEAVTGQERARVKVKIGADPSGPVAGNQTSPITSLAVADDGRTVAIGCVDHIIHLVDIVAGKALGTLLGHQGKVVALAFSADRKKLYSGSADTTVLTWDLGTMKLKEIATDEVTEDNAKELWAELTGTDGAKSYRTIMSLARAPDQVLPILKENLKPTPKLQDDRITQLIKNLGSEDFDIRQDATAELEKLGDAAEHALEETLKSGPNLEERQRLERLVDKVSAPKLLSPAVVQALRGVEILEQIGNAEARQLLEALAKGEPTDPLTREAKRALARTSSTPVRTVAP